MSCRDTHTDLAGLRPGEEIGIELEAHLGECVQCRRVLVEDRQVWRLLDDCEVPAAPAALFASVEQLLEPRERAGSARTYAMAAAAAILLGLGVGGWLGSAVGGGGADAAAAVATPLDEDVELFDDSPPGSLTWAYLAVGSEEETP